MKLNDKIRILRKMRGWSQEELGYNLSKTCKDGISRQAISDWENGRSEPKLDNIRDLADVLGVSFDVLLDENIDLDNPETIKELINKNQDNTNIKDKELKVTKQANVLYNYYRSSKIPYLWMILLSILILSITLFIYLAIKWNENLFFIDVAVFLVISIWVIYNIIKDFNEHGGSNAGRIEYGYVKFHLRNSRADDVCLPYSLIDKIYIENIHGKSYADLVFKLKDGKEYKQEKIYHAQKVLDIINDMIDEYNKE